MLATTRSTPSRDVVIGGGICNMIVGAAWRPWWDITTWSRLDRRGGLDLSTFFLHDRIAANWPV